MTSSSPALTLVEAEPATESDLAHLRARLWAAAECAGLDVRARVELTLAADRTNRAVQLQLCDDGHVQRLVLRCGSRVAAFQLPARQAASALAEDVAEARTGSPDWVDRQLRELSRTFATLDGRLASFERAYERQRVAAETLQHALLPLSLPASRDITCAARYLPATSGVRIGGDWYDAFVVARGRIVLTVGDVTGHGLDAAVVMGRLRTAARAYALEGHGPGAVLLRLSRMLQASSDEPLASAVVVLVDLRRASVTWAVAGHPPPLVRRPDGAVEHLDGEGWPLLGIEAAVGPRERTAPVERGSVLALYSDGLVERRGTILDEGIARLRDALGVCDPRDLPGSASSTVDRMLAGRTREDDTCLLLARYGAARRTTPAWSSSRRTSPSEA